MRSDELDIGSVTRDFAQRTLVTWKSKQIESLNFVLWNISHLQNVSIVTSNTENQLAIRLALRDGGWLFIFFLREYTTGETAVGGGQHDRK